MTRASAPPPAVDRGSGVDVFHDVIIAVWGAPQRGFKRNHPSREHPLASPLARECRVTSLEEVVCLRLLGYSGAIIRRCALWDLTGRRATPPAPLVSTAQHTPHFESGVRGASPARSTPLNCAGTLTRWSQQ